MEKINCSLCLQSKFSFQNILKHYEYEHKIEKTNELLIKHLKSLTLPNNSKVESCVICEEVTDDIRQKYRHMLYSHHNLCSKQIENLPIKKTVNFIRDINKIVYTASIYRTEHFYEYDWNNPDTADTFLETAKLLIDSLRVTDPNPSKRINVSVSYTIVNKDIRSVITRYLPVRSWTTAVFRTKTLNESIMDSLSGQIKSKIIQNGESGSHIVFSHFKSFQMNVSSVNDEEILAIFGGDDEIPKVGHCLNALILLGIFVATILFFIIIIIIRIL